MRKTTIKKCTDCPLGNCSSYNKLPAKIGSNSKLVIYLDSPNMEDARSQRLGESRSTALLLWLLKRMSVSLDNVMIDYSLKCYKPKDQLKKKDDRLKALKACRFHSLQNLDEHKAKVFVTMGSASCEAMLGGQALKDKVGAWWETYGDLKHLIPKTFVSYSPAYAIESPGETTTIYGLLWLAAKEAGLNPKFDPKVKPFNYDN